MTQSTAKISRILRGNIERRIPTVGDVHKLAALSDRNYGAAFDLTQTCLTKLQTAATDEKLPHHVRVAAAQAFNEMQKGFIERGYKHLPPIHIHAARQRHPR